MQIVIKVLLVINVHLSVNELCELCVTMFTWRLTSGVLIQATTTKSFFGIIFNFHPFFYTSASNVVLPATFYMHFCESFSCFLHVLNVETISLP